MQHLVYYPKLLFKNSYTRNKMVSALFPSPPGLATFVEPTNSYDTVIARWQHAPALSHA
jgi:hypothetical protein